MNSEYYKKYKKYKKMYKEFQKIKGGQPKGSKGRPHSQSLRGQASPYSSNPKSAKVSKSLQSKIDRFLALYKRLYDPPPSDSGLGGVQWIPNWPGSDSYTPTAKDEAKAACEIKIPRVKQLIEAMRDQSAAAQAVAAQAVADAVADTAQEGELGGTPLPRYLYRCLSNSQPIPVDGRINILGEPQFRYGASDTWKGGSEFILKQTIGTFSNINPVYVHTSGRDESLELFEESGMPINWFLHGSRSPRYGPCISTAKNLAALIEHTFCGAKDEKKHNKIIVQIDIQGLHFEDGIKANLLNTNFNTSISQLPPRSRSGNIININAESAPKTYYFDMSAPTGTDNAEKIYYAIGQPEMTTALTVKGEVDKDSPAQGAARTVGEVDLITNEISLDRVRVLYAPHDVLGTDGRTMEPDQRSET